MVLRGRREDTMWPQTLKEQRDSRKDELLSLSNIENEKSEVRERPTHWPTLRCLVILAFLPNLRGKWPTYFTLKIKISSATVASRETMPLFVRS